MPPHGAAYNTDWIFSNNSNAHLANHRDWFTSYTAFPSHANDNSLVIHGVGDVHLDVRTGDGSTHQAFVLRDVIFAPNARTNILGAPIFGLGHLSLTSEGGSIEDGETGTAYLLDRAEGLWKLWLAGQLKGQTSSERGGVYYINVSWPEGERQRWAEETRQRAGRGG